MVSDAKLQEHVIPAMNAKGRGGEAGARLNTRPIDYCLLYASTSGSCMAQPRRPTLNVLYTRHSVCSIITIKLLRLKREPSWLRVSGRLNTKSLRLQDVRFKTTFDKPASPRNGIRIRHVLSIEHRASDLHSAYGPQEKYTRRRLCHHAHHSMEHQRSADNQRLPTMVQARRLGSLPGTSRCRHRLFPGNQDDTKAAHRTHVYSPIL